MSNGSRGPTPRIEFESFKRMWLAGVASKDIAEHFGVKPPAVSRCARVHGLPRRPYGRPKPTDPNVTATYIAKPKMNVPPTKKRVMWTYAEVDRMVAEQKLTRTQALQQFHRMRSRSLSITS